MKKKFYQTKKICIGTIEVCGILMKLKRSYHDMGLVCDCFLLHSVPQQADDESEYNNPSLDFYKHLQARIRASKKEGKKVRYRLLQIVEMILLLQIFIHTLFVYDAYIFLYAHSFFTVNPYLNRIKELEYKILKLCNKQIIAMFCGSDSRPPYCDCFSSESLEDLKKATRRISSNVRMIEKYAEVIDGPASAAFHTKPYISYNCIGNPVEEVEFQGKIKISNENKCNAVKILHAPSSANAKGTDIIRKTIEGIMSAGYKVEYKEISGVQHKVVLEEIGKADILINQMYSDVPMSMLDVEAGLNGVAVITCGYYAEYYKEDMPAPIPPTCFCIPEKLEENLIYYILHEEERNALGKAEQNFIKENWMSKQIADRLLQIMEKRIPVEWLYYPEKSYYIWGAGCTKEKVIEKVLFLVDHYGSEALCISENSLIFKEYMQLYKTEKERKTKRGGIV
jgi:hypothetical protein